MIGVIIKPYVELETLCVREKKMFTLKVVCARKMEKGRKLFLHGLIKRER